MATQPRDIDSPISVLLSIPARWTLPDYGPSQPNSRFQLFRFRRSRVACRPSRVGSCRGLPSTEPTVQDHTFAQATNRQPASQTGEESGGHLAWQGLIPRVPCTRPPDLPGKSTWPLSLSLSYSHHTHTTLIKPRYMHRFLLQYQACCRRSSGAAPNFTPATDPFLPVSHMPPVAPICSPTGPTNRR